MKVLVTNYITDIPKLLRKCIFNNYFIRNFKNTFFFYFVSYLIIQLNKIVYYETLIQ